MSKAGDFLSKIKDLGGNVINEVKEAEKAKEINKLIPVIIIGSIALFLGGMWFQRKLKR